jgi:2-dehydro-3-deoxyphosphogluconate aldolase / (4S)-4-hydroxy-2-oxoglutarate aldolase
MISRADITQAIIDQGVLPLFFHPDVNNCVDVVRTLYRAGVRVIEFTNRGEAALENFKALKQLQQNELPGLLLAIGTIKTGEQAIQYIDAGADFLISPMVDDEVAATAAKHNIMWVPGCMTPTEINQANRAGADFVKIFPANVVGPGFVSAVKEVFPGVKMMPTGGVELAEGNLRGWFDAGVAAVGLGSKLISKKILEEKNYSQLYNDTVRALELIKEVR